MRLLGETTRIGYGTKGLTKQIGTFECPRCNRVLIVSTRSLGDVCFRCKSALTKLANGKDKFYQYMENSEYTISKFEYTGIDKPGIVVCNIHGDFLASPNHLMNGHGCPECGRLKAANKLITNKAEVFFSEYGDKLNLSKFIYTRNNHKGIVICEQHGEYLATPNSIRGGSRCPECARLTTGYTNNYTSTLPHILYYVYIPSINMWKIGVTRISIQERFRKFKIDVQVVSTFNYRDGASAYDAEKAILNTLISLRYKTQMLAHIDTPNLLPNGNYELFIEDILNRIPECIETH